MHATFYFFAKHTNGAHIQIGVQGSPIEFLCGGLKALSQSLSARRFIWFTIMWMGESKHTYCDISAIYSVKSVYWSLTHMSVSSQNCNL